MKDLVCENLEKAQKQQKAWYDRNARHRELEVVLEPVFGEQLNQLQKEELAGVLAEFTAVFSNTPGRTPNRVWTGKANQATIVPYSTRVQGSRTARDQGDA
ncbi:hypothetical protein EMCRGX_G015314 [Ephydatia muelleri]